MALMKVIGTILIIGCIFASAFFQLSAIVWTALIGIALLLVTILGWMPTTLLVIFWLGFLAAALFTHLRVWRETFLIKPAIPRLKKLMPTVSETERVALEAGDTWWEKEMFCGKPDWRKLFRIPKPTLSPEEQDFINNQVDHLCKLINDWEFVYTTHDLSPEVWAYLKEQKFFGLVIPKRYGGLGFSALAHSTIVTKISSCSISTAVTAMVPNSLGPAELLLHYGTDEQKDYYLPRLARGEEMPCFGLTGPEAGSDAGNMPDIGVVCYDEFEGEKTLGIRLSWDKRYITLAPVSTVLGIAFKLYDPDHLIGEQEDIGITLCLIPTTHPGVEIGLRHLPMSLAFMNGPTRGKDVFIPLSWVIGGQAMLGQGWRMLMESLSIGRSISLPALSTGSVKISYHNAGAYARIRRQFNTSIANFEGIQEALGFIAGYTYLIESIRIMTAGAIDQNINPSIVSAIAKYHMTEMCRMTVSHAMDIHGGHMIQGGPRNYLANIYIGLPISITVEGANILTRNLIIFGQGAIRCHPYLLQEVTLISAPEVNVTELDKVLMKHIGYFTNNFLRTLGYGLTGGLFIVTNIKNKAIKKYQRQLTRMSAALALLADTSLILLGGSLKRKESISARLGDIMSQLYIASTVLKYYHDNHCPETDVDYVCWCLSYCLHKIQNAITDLLNNFPHPIVAGILRFTVFPFGRHYHAPSDKLHHALLKAMLSNSELRERLTRYTYLDGSSSLSAELNKSLNLIETMEPLWKKLQQAERAGVIPEWYDFQQKLHTAEVANVLTKDEVKQLEMFEKLKNDIISVDEFSFDLEEIITQPNHCQEMIYARK